MALDTTIDLSLVATLTKLRDFAVTAQDPLAVHKRVKLLNGTGAGKADRLWYDERTLAASTAEDLDLVGALTDAFGDTFSPVRVKAFYVEAAPLSGTANTNNVVVGDAAANTWAAFLGADGTMTLRPGSFNLLVAGPADATGYVCAAGATDTLKVANSGAGTPVTYQIAVIGVSA